MSWTAFHQIYVFCVSYCEFERHLQTGVNGTKLPLETADEVKLQIFFFSTFNSWKLPERPCCYFALTKHTVYQQHETSP